MYYIYTYFVESLTICKWGLSVHVCKYVCVNVTFNVCFPQEPHHHLGGDEALMWHLCSSLFEHCHVLTAVTKLAVFFVSRLTRIQGGKH